eukprot:TRINITY_DN3547_c0_g1_i1.p1 TRINITY_DN3547_c0_g1~~TRINITY_DN3547_c0_g1_i1.p1  ORF type:complete len:400 (-),score=85.33 TRINITY_DN3547_c0_g1_i1:943-2142(-)
MSNHKYYIHYGDGETAFTKKMSAIQGSMTVYHSRKAFVKSYNKKHVADPLDLYFVRLTYNGELLPDNGSISDLVENLGDVMAIVDYTIEVRCGNNGCGKVYLEEENFDNSCQYHHGNALFHEGLKGWTCCKKRVFTFDEIFEIPGCTFGKHTREKPKIKKLAQQTRTAGYQEVTMVENDGNTEVYRPQNASSTIADAVVPKKKPVKEINNDLKDPSEISFPPADDPDVFIKLGTECTRFGCVRTFQGDFSRQEECWFHPGKPVFHEGSKGYTCCRRRTLLFDDFLKLEGCVVDRHKFIPEPKVDEGVKCRHDFYQIGPTITFSIFAKKVIEDDVSINIEPKKISVVLPMEDGKVFEKEYTLWGEIIPEECSYRIMTPKVEFKLPKTNNSSGTWPQILAD